MNILIIYDPYGDTYTTKINCLFDRNILWKITVFDDILFIDANGSSLRFTHNFDKSDIIICYIYNLDTGCNFERIAEYFKPLIEEILMTRDIELMKYLYKSLFPLLNKMMLTQRMIDEYELPQKVPTKSARNYFFENLFL
jgi:hypothetical protein